MMLQERMDPTVVECKCARIHGGDRGGDGSGGGRESSLVEDLEELDLELECRVRGNDGWEAACAVRLQ